MTDITAIAGWLAAILVFFASVPYVNAIFGRDLLFRDIPTPTRPNRATWFIWAFLGTIELLAYKDVGAIHTLWVPLEYAVLYWLIALLSLKFGTGGWSLIDRLCIIGAAGSAALWGVLSFVADPFTAALITLVITILIDILGFLPTIVHAWQTPEEEDRIAWTIGLAGAAVNLLAVGSWAHTVSALAIAIYPVYNFALVGVIVAALWFTPNKRQPLKQIA